MTDMAAKKAPEYSWKPGYRGGTIPAADAYQELERISQKYGGLRPHEVLEEARPEDAPLHPEFVWDDHTLAEQARLDQARRLIRAVVQTRANEAARRVWVYVPDREDAQYQRMEVAAKRDDARLSALIHLRQQVSEAERALEEFTSVCEAQGADDVLMARLRIAAQAAVSLRLAIDGIN